MQIYPDLNLLKTFTMVADDLSFTTVAEKRNTVQSAISAQIKRLENTMGQTLIARGRGLAMRLTPEGEAYLVYARRILSLSDEAVETVRTARSRTILRLGTTVTLAMSVVADVLKEFSNARPDVQLQIQCDRSDRLLERLTDGDIDVAFMMDQGRHPTRKFVHSMDLTWVCSPAFELPATGAIPLAFLTDGRDLRRYALSALDACGLRGHVTHLSPDPIGVRTLVQGGLALTIMPRATIVAPLIQAPNTLGLPDLPQVALAAYLGTRDGLTGADALLDRLEASAKAASARE